jgi:hypothetical protein
MLGEVNAQSRACSSAVEFVDNGDCSCPGFGAVPVQPFHRLHTGANPGMPRLNARRRLGRVNTPLPRLALHTLQGALLDNTRFPYTTTLQSESRKLSQIRDPNNDVIHIEAQTANPLPDPATADNDCKSGRRAPFTTAATESMNGSAIRTYTHEAMMRNKPASSMQKTYDECYLICSTAVYFEGQVRWRNTSCERYNTDTSSCRTMRPKPYARGGLLSTRSTTTMLTKCPLHTSPRPMSRGLCRSR